MRYACRYWASHIRAPPNTSDNSIQPINPTIGFLRNNAALRIEVMHLENQP